MAFYLHCEILTCKAKMEMRLELSLLFASLGWGLLMMYDVTRLCLINISTADSQPPPTLK